MQKLILFSTFVTFASALIQCPTDICSRLDCAAMEDCNGRVKVGGGWCGCCDVCMTQIGEGESCMHMFLLGGAPSTVECGQGLQCSPATGKCESMAAAKRDATVGPCTSRLNEIQRAQQNGIPLLGVTEPKCDDNGNFAPVQCYGSVCYCVDNTGTEIDGYQVNIGESANMNCKCALDLTAYMKTGLIGKLFYCDKNGNYQQNQVQETTMMPVVAAAKTTAGSGSVLTGVLTGAEIAARGACAKELASMQNADQSLLGAFVPECDADGKYTPRQCLGSECYCARKDGTKIEGYSAPIAQKDHVTCQCARDKDTYTSMGLLGRIHTCRQNGNYQQYQCLGSVCYCTDDMGNRLEAQSVSIGDINNLKCP